MFADFALQNGTPLGSVAQFVDIFTWGGFFKAVGFAAALTSIKYIIQGMVDVMLMAVVFMVTPDLKFCGPDDLTIFGFDFCLWIVGNEYQGGGLKEFGEAADVLGY